MNTHQTVTGEGNAPCVKLDSPKDGPRTDIIRTHLNEAKASIRFAELIAGEDALWHLAEDCRNLYLKLDVLLAKPLEGE